MKTETDNFFKEIIRKIYKRRITEESRHIQESDNKKADAERKEITQADTNSK